MASGSGGSASPSQKDDYETPNSTTDVERLKIAWRNEKAAPEILQFEARLVERAMEQIHLLEETVELLAKDGVDPLILSMYQMDLDRTQFLLRSYLRIRLQKIEKYMFHILNTELQNRLSEQERDFARRCTNDLANHLEGSVLSKLPEHYNDILKQSITSEENDMVPVPPVDTFVVFRSRGFVGPIHLEDSNEPLFTEKGDLCFIRYNQIKPFLEKGEVDLV